MDPAIDALTHVCSFPDSLQYIEKNKQDSIDALVDILRQQPDCKIVYKSLRCLTKFAENLSLAQRFMQKGGPASTVNLF